MAESSMSETPPVPPGSLQQAPGAASPKRTRVRNRVKLPRPTREQQRLAEAILPLLDEAERHIEQEQPTRALEILQGAAPEPPPYLSPHGQLRWYWLAGAAWLATEQLAEARTWLERGLALAGRLRPYVLAKQEEGFDTLTERLRALLGEYYFQTGQPGQALLIHRQGLLAIHSGTLSDQATQVRIYAALGNDALALGQPHDAIGYFTLAHQRPAALRDDRQRGLVAWGLGRAYAAAQEDKQARAAFEEALQRFAAHGMSQQQAAQLHAALGEVLLRLQDYPRAEAHIQQSLEAARRSGERALRAAALGTAAALYIATGQIDQAISSLQAGLELLTTSQDTQARARLTLALAGAHQARQEAAAAEQAFQEALTLARQSADSALLTQAHERYAAFLSSQGRFQEAFAEVEAARALQTRGSTRG